MTAAAAVFGSKTQCVDRKKPIQTNKKIVNRYRDIINNVVLIKDLLNKKTKN